MRAFVTTGGPVQEMADSDVLSHFEVNTLGPLRLFKAMALLLQKASTPKFVYISTLLASIREIERLPSLTTAYGMSKVAGNYLVKKIDAKNKHLIALSIHPGYVNLNYSTLRKASMRLTLLVLFLMIRLVQTDMGVHAAELHGLEKAPVTV